jgi:hypothetical protein
MPDLIYASNQITEAVLILASHPGRINERLTEVAHKTLAALDPEVFRLPGINAVAPIYWERSGRPSRQPGTMRSSAFLRPRSVDLAR